MTETSEREGFGRGAVTISESCASRLDFETSEDIGFSRLGIEEGKKVRKKVSK